MDKCSIDDCSKPRKARGLCSTHYNRTRPNNHRRVIAICDWCGGESLKYARNEQRYEHQYCSRTCRDDAIRKVWPTCSLPDDHWGRWFGKSSAWRTEQPRPTFFANSCDDCGQAFIERAYGVPSTYCSETCTKRVAKRRRRGREHQAPGFFTFNQLIHQFIAQDRLCAYCHSTITGTPDPEHVTPLSRGGRNDMSNIVASCRQCNTDKGDLTLDEWAADRARRSLPPVDVSLASEAYKSIVRSAASRPAWRHRAASESAA